ncbi:10458_t:CDS:2, partial [Dentiscutata erythropus]
MEVQWGSNPQSKTLPEVSNDLGVLQEDLTEENSDVWDDSALITAWDHAVKEYESFHSIKTEKTTNKIDNIKNKGALSKKTQSTSDSESGEASTPISVIENASAKRNNNKKAGSFPEKPTNAEAKSSTDQTQKERNPNASYYPGWRPMQPPKPQTAIPPPMIDDDALSNLLMAWYYSGYYTGLFQ